MVEDKRFLDIFWQMALEIEAHLVDYNRRMSGVTDKATHMAERTKYNDELLELIHKHQRAIQFMEGKEVKPEIQFGEAVVVGIGSIS